MQASLLVFAMFSVVIPSLICGRKIGSETLRIIKLLNGDDYNVEGAAAWDKEHRKNFSYDQTLRRLPSSISDYVDGHLYGHPVQISCKTDVDPINLELTSDEPVYVNVSIYVEGIGGLDIGQMSFSLDIYLKMRWYDERLKHNNIEGVELTTNNVNNVWIPDLYFVNARKAAFQAVLKPNNYLHIRPSGLVIMNIRVLLEPTCVFRLHDFPFDTQACGIKMMSYSGSTKWVVLGWRENEPIELNGDIELPEMEIVDSVPTSDLVPYKIVLEGTNEIKARNFSRLTLKMRLKRRPSHYITMLYVPNAVIVVISWLSFWIDAQATPARVGLCFTSFLTLTTAVIATSKLLPPVSYTTALGIWTDVCVVFVFATLLEFAIVHMYAKRASHLKAKPTQEGGEKMTPKDVAQKVVRFVKISKRIDQLSRIFFPVCFAIFVISYGAFYRPKYFQ